MKGEAGSDPKKGEEGAMKIACALQIKNNLSRDQCPIFVNTTIPILNEGKKSLMKIKSTIKCQWKKFDFIHGKMQ